MNEKAARNLTQNRECSWPHSNLSISEHTTPSFSATLYIKSDVKLSFCEFHITINVFVEALGSLSKTSF